MIALRTFGHAFYWSVVWPVEKRVVAVVAATLFFILVCWPIILMLGWFAGMIVAVKLGCHVDGRWTLALLFFLGLAYWWYDKYLSKR